MAGLSPVEPEPELVIPEMVKAGELPLTTCIVCGLDADAVHYWLVECQRQHARFDSHAPSLGLVLFGPMLWLLMGPFILLRPNRSFESAAEVHGRDVYVRAPFRACEHCISQVSQTWLDSLLKVARWLMLIAGILILLVNPFLGLGVIAASMFLQAVRFFRNNRLREVQQGCLRKIPMFARLFKKYPQAVITDDG
jgi:hypothetical protein